MMLSSEEARVLACLLEQHVAESGEYPLALNALRLACNRSEGRDPVVTYDDRTVEAALLSLKSRGLVRFVEPAGGGPVVRYRHTADERWRLNGAEVGVLAMLVLGGPKTPTGLRRALHVAGHESAIDDSAIEEALDALASRRPEPFAARIDPRRDGEEVRFAHLLTGEVDAGSADRHGSVETAMSEQEVSELAALTAEVAFLRARVIRLEHELGLGSGDADHDEP